MADKPEMPEAKAEAAGTDRAAPAAAEDLAAVIASAPQQAGGPSGSRRDVSTMDDAERWRRSIEQYKSVGAWMSHCPEQFSRRVRRGVPPACRWETWKAAVHYDQRVIPGAYAKLTERPSRWRQAIKLDCPRTFPDDPVNFDKAAQKMLENVLNAYANLNEETGYCQGLNFAAALLIIVSERKEEEAFWVLVALMEYDGLHGFYREGFPLLRRYLRALDRLVRRELPELHEHFIRENVQPACYLHQWLLKLFVDCLPLPAVLRLWDMIVCDGLPSTLAIALAILKSLRKVLLEKRFEEIVRFFKTMRVNDANYDGDYIGKLLVKQSYRVHLSQDILGLLRENVPEGTSDEWISYDPAVDSSRGGAEGAAPGRNWLSMLGDPFSLLSNQG